MNLSETKDLLKTIANTNMVALPTTRFKAFLRKALIKEQKFSLPSAETIAARMVVELGPNPIADADLVELAASYAQVIANMRDAFAELGFQEPARAVENSAEQSTLKWS